MGGACGKNVSRLTMDLQICSESSYCSEFFARAGEVCPTVVTKRVAIGALEARLSGPERIVFFFGVRVCTRVFGVHFIVLD